MQLIRKLIIKGINKLKRDLDKSINYSNENYFGQEGEDIILSRIFNKSNGRYIDIGAHHPFRFSNTYHFYQKGWVGINIDPNPDSINEFNKQRPKDINIQCGVSDKNEKLTYYKFDEPALNGFSKKLSDDRNDNTNYKIIEEIIVPVKPLSEILDQYLLPNNVEIDFMSIDVEGLDFKVLQSNNWPKYRPKIVLIEILATDLLAIYNTEENKFLENIGYVLFAKTYNTCFYKLKS